MLDARKLVVLRDLAHFGTIAAVAEARSYTPSAVSQQLAALEREAGIPLLKRTGRRVSLTPAGAVLVDHAEEVHAALERASAALAAARTRLVGPLRIGAFPSAVRTLLPDVLVGLGRDHPGLELMVVELDPAAAPNALRSGHLDVALVHDYDHVPIEPDAALTTEPLLEETMYLASLVPPADSSDDAIRSACDASWILGSPNTLCHTVTIRACQAAGFTPRVRHHVDDFVTVLALVAAGQGVALIPMLAAINAPDGVILTALPTRRRTHVALRRGTAGNPAIAAFMAAVRASAASFVQNWISPSTS